MKRYQRCPVTKLLLAALLVADVLGISFCCLPTGTGHYEVADGGQAPHRRAVLCATPDPDEAFACSFCVRRAPDGARPVTNRGSRVDRVCAPVDIEGAPVVGPKTAQYLRPAVHRFGPGPCPVASRSRAPPEI